MSAYEGWVPEPDRARFFRIEQSLGELENDPASREAAATLFWQIYFKQYPEVTDLNILSNRIYRILVREGDRRKNVIDTGDKSKLESVAFVHLHLVAILLRAIRNRCWGSEELVDDLVQSGGSAFDLLSSSEYEGVLRSSRYIYKLLGEAGIDIPRWLEGTPRLEPSRPEPSEVERQRKRSLSVVAAMFYNEAFHARKEAHAYQEALAHFARATALWSAAMLEASGSELSDELSLQEAADCFESLRSAKSAVSNWQEVAEACSLICDSLWDDVLSSEQNLSPEQELKDSQGVPWQAVNYWQRAATLAEADMTPSEFVEASALKENSRHRERLQRDFFDEDWQELEEDTRKALVQMEISWYEAAKQGGRREAAVNELRLVFEHELHATVFAPAQPSITRMLENRQMRRDLGLTGAGGPSSLGLRDMAILLEEAGRRDSFKALDLKQFIEGCRLSPDDKAFLYTELPTHLHNLAGTRRGPEHRLASAKLLGEIRDLRRKALGIGEPSYLRRLTKIKRAMRGDRMSG